MNEKTLAALSSAIYLSRLTLRGETADTDDKRLRASGLYPDWGPGVHKSGEVYNAGGADLGVHPELRHGGLSRHHPRRTRLGDLPPAPPRHHAGDGPAFRRRDGGP